MTGAWILGATAAVIAAIAIVTNFPRIGRSLRVGDRVRIAGGYDEPPDWLQGKAAVIGTVRAFLADGALEVELDEPIVVDGVSYPLVLLRLRYKRARWSPSEIVHVEGWTERPSSPSASAQHEWIESHANYRRVRRGLG